MLWPCTTGSGFTAACWTAGWLLAASPTLEILADDPPALSPSSRCLFSLESCSCPQETSSVHHIRELGKSFHLPALQLTAPADRVKGALTLQNNKIWIPDTTAPPAAPNISRCLWCFSMFSDRVSGLRQRNMVLQIGTFQGLKATSHYEVELRFVMPG